MTKYHISEDGEVRECTAEEGNCPVQAPNEESYHSTNKEELKVKAQEVLEEEFGKFSSLSHNSYEDYYASLNGHPFIREHQAVARGEIPRDFHFPDSSSNNYLQSEKMYAKITKNFCEDMRAILPDDAVVLDPMAGRGFLTKGFNEAGIPTIGSDLYADDLNVWVGDPTLELNALPLLTEIEKLDAIEAVEKYGDKITHLALAWPPYGNEIDCRILKKLEEYPNVEIIYIGEPSGATGSEEFWEELAYREDWETVNLETRYRTAPYLKDIPFILRRVNSKE